MLKGAIWFANLDGLIHGNNKRGKMPHRSRWRFPAAALQLHLGINDAQPLLWPRMPTSSAASSTHPRHVRFTVPYRFRVPAIAGFAVAIIIARTNNSLGPKGHHRADGLIRRPDRFPSPQQYGGSANRGCLDASASVLHADDTPNTGHLRRDSAQNRGGIHRLTLRTYRQRHRRVTVWPSVAFCS